MKNHKKLWLEFNHLIVNQVQDEFTKDEFFELILNWLIKNMKSFGEEVWTLYRFNEYVEYEPLDYSIERSADSVHNIRERTLRLMPSSTDSIAMIIRDILWDMVAYKSDIECTNCGDDDYRVLYDENLEEIILSCDLCGFSQFKDGKNFLVPAKINKLRFNFQERLLL